MVDACLIPEVSFVLHGEHGLLKYIEGVLQARGHAVICIAEGAGQARRSRLRPHDAASSMLDEVETHVRRLW